MNYIINPSWFYWISVVDGLRIVGFTMVIVFGIAACIFVPMAIYEKHEYGGYSQDDSDYAKEYIREMNLVCKWAKIVSFVTIALSIVLILVPSRNTLIEMQIAKMATYENAQWTVDSLKSVVDYIIEAIQKVK